MAIFNSYVCLPERKKHDVAYKVLDLQKMMPFAG
jgi:hypothetical protein